jgi:hypothetical protein
VGSISKTNCELLFPPPKKLVTVEAVTNHCNGS